MAELDLAALNVSTHDALALALLGGTVEGINDRGVIATANIPPNTVIAQIPLTSTISSSALLANVEEFSALSTFANSSSSLSDDDLICLAIILSRKESCSHPYLSTFSGFTNNFPATFDSTIFLTPGSLPHNLLKGTNLMHSTAMLQNQIAQDHAVLLKLLQDFSMVHVDMKDFFPTTEEDFGLEDYVHGLFSVYSRACDLSMSVEGRDAGRVRLLCPFLDMLNHSTTSKVFYEFDTETGSVKIKTGEDEILKDSEVTLNYGPLPNSKLLLFYGFSLPNNAHDFAELFVPLNPDLALYSSKLELLKTLSPTYLPSQPFQIKKGGAIPSTLLSLLRIMPLTDLEGVDATSPISDSNELGVLSALEGALQGMSQAISGNLLLVGDDRKAEEDVNSIAEYEKVRIYVESELEILSTALQEVRGRISAIQEGLEGCD
ncbi:hypothetical protein TrST_g8149 [Triparma strigata]|uniref:SET domain-containing protein n=1 Tax=Triparma strigata TaxID=1606541 RepID=A0A9W7EI63_9STRA|nr:hypothetical protein TrST_g8149 [Triparma strigata]